MKRKKSDVTTPAAKDEYEQSYGDAQIGGWAPRGRWEDLVERSRYSSQRDRQEDRSGFVRGYQGKGETAEEHGWSSRHARGDEDGWSPADEATHPPEPLLIEPVNWLKRKRAATRKRKAAAPAGKRATGRRAKSKPAKAKPAKPKARSTPRARGRRRS